MSDRQIILLDGVEVGFEPDETVFQVAKRVGKLIPSLCQDDRLEPGGHCRLCLVRVAGMARPAASCTLKATPGLDVVTADEELEETRRTLLEMILSENPEEECGGCTVVGPCEMHALASRLGVARGRFLGSTSGEPHQDDNPFLGRNYAQCISCYRCTRICDEVQGDAAIAPAGRGFLTRIAAAFDRKLQASSCSFCGQCIHACPTGALTDRKLAHLSRPQREVTQTLSVCTYCGTGCSIRLHAQDGALVGVTPNREGPANEGALCVKGQFAFDFVQSDERLTTPLIRENGRFREAGWDEALDLVATRLSSIKRQHGGDAFYAIASGRAPNESAYALQKFARAVMGTHQIDNCSRG